MSVQPSRRAGAARAVALGLSCSFGLSFGLSFGCSGRPRDGAQADRQSPSVPSKDPAAAAAVTKEKRVYDVASTSDLLTVQSKYLEQAAAGYEGRFEVRFTAAIPPTGWSLAPEAGKELPAIDLVLTGVAGASVPVPGKLIARSVTIQHLVLTGPVGLSSEIEVRTAFTMRDSAVIDGRGTVTASQAPYLAIRAHGARGKKEPATLTVERSWFVRNWQADQSQGAALLGLEQHAQHGGFFGTVRISDCVFLGNAFTTELRLAYAIDVAIERSVFYRPQPWGVLFDAALVQSVKVTDSVVVVHDVAHVGHLGEDVEPIELGNTRIYPTAYDPSRPLPTAIQVDRGAIALRSTIEAKLAPFDAAGKLPVAMPAAELRAQLLQALLSN
jgi:hypothetical protein